jgi:Flp pilus assembly protein TadD
MCASLARNQAAYWLDCEALFRHALAVTENNYVIHDCYGAVLADRGRSEEAARQFQAAIRARPRDEVAYYNLGVLLAKQKKYDAAVAMYQQALAIKPDYYEVQNNLGILLAEQGRLLEALTHLDRAVQLKSDDALAHKNMALLLGQFAEAPGEANDVVRQLAGGPPAAAALRHCQKALALSPAAPGLLGLMGYCLMLNNRREEAESYLRRALAANPDDAVAAYQLARLLDARGEAAESLLRLKKSVTPEADNHEAANAAARSRATSRD